MKKYHVEVPVVMKLMVGVEAENEDEAVNKVFNGEITFNPTFDENEFDFVDYEWDMYQKIVEGNVFYGMINNVHVEEEE